MTPPLLSLSSVVSGMGLPLMEASVPPDLATAIQQLTNRFATGAAAVLTLVNLAVVDIVLVCLLVGVLLYFRHEAKRSGKDRVVGGVLLAVISEYVIPAVSAVSKYSARRSLGHIAGARLSPRGRRPACRSPTRTP